MKRKTEIKVGGKKVEKTKTVFNKLWEYIKNNKFYITVMVLGTIALLLQMKYVVFYSDDVCLGVIAKQEGWLGAIEHLKSNYMNWGGGPTPFIAIIFLMYRISVWKIFNIAMIIIIVVLSVKMITYNNKTNKGIIATCIWCLIFVLNINISRQTIYWLDGNMAYVLTTFQMFIYFYYLYSRIIMKTVPRKYDYVILPIFAFFAGWSGPQAGAITVLIPLILLGWAKFINKEKIKPIYIITWVIGLIGFLVYYLAPGNNGRLAQVNPEFMNYNIVEKVLYRSKEVWEFMFSFETYKFACIPFYLYVSLGLISAIAINRTKNKTSKFDKIVSILAKALMVFTLFSIVLGFNCEILVDLKEKIMTFSPLLETIQNNTFKIYMLIPYIITGLALLAGIIISYYISYKEEKTPFLFIVFTSAILTQIMMMLAPVGPFRTAFITVTLLWSTIAYLIKLLKNYEMIDKTGLTIIGIVLIMITFLVYSKTLKGYKDNSYSYYENVNRIELFKDNPTEDNILYLQPPKDPIFGYDSFKGSEWLENSVKEYYGLDKSVILEYENTVENQ